MKNHMLHLSTALFYSIRELADFDLRVEPSNSCSFAVELVSLIVVSITGDPIHEREK